MENSRNSFCPRPLKTRGQKGETHAPRHPSRLAPARQIAAQACADTPPAASGRSLVRSPAVAGRSACRAPSRPRAMGDQQQDQARRHPVPGEPLLRPLFRRFREQARARRQEAGGRFRPGRSRLQGRCRQAPSPPPSHPVLRRRSRPRLGRQPHQVERRRDGRLGQGRGRQDHGDRLLQIVRPSLSREARRRLHPGRPSFLRPDRADAAQPALSVERHQRLEPSHSREHRLQPALQQPVADRAAARAHLADHGRRARHGGPAVEVLFRRRRLGAVGHRRVQSADLSSSRFSPTR